MFIGCISSAYKNPWNSNINIFQHFHIQTHDFLAAFSMYVQKDFVRGRAADSGQLLHRKSIYSSWTLLLRAVRCQLDTQHQFLPLQPMSGENWESLWKFLPQTERYAVSSESSIQPCTILCYCCSKINTLHVAPGTFQLLEDVVENTVLQINTARYWIPKAAASYIFAFGNGSYLKTAIRMTVWINRLAIRLMQQFSEKKTDWTYDHKVGIYLCLKSNWILCYLYFSFPVFLHSCLNFAQMLPVSEITWLFSLVIATLV